LPLWGEGPAGHLVLQRIEHHVLANLPTLDPDIAESLLAKQFPAERSSVTSDTRQIERQPTSASLAREVAEIPPPDTDYSGLSEQRIATG
jgi:hypothetical protein